MCQNVTWSVQNALFYALITSIKQPASLLKCTLYKCTIEQMYSVLSFVKCSESKNNDFTRSPAPPLHSLVEQTFFLLVIVSNTGHIQGVSPPSSGSLAHVSAGAYCPFPPNRCDSDNWGKTTSEGSTYSYSHLYTGSGEGRQVISCYLILLIFQALYFYFLFKFSIFNSVYCSIILTFNCEYLLIQTFHMFFIHLRWIIF